jgi:hypothetical protein
MKNGLISKALVLALPLCAVAVAGVARAQYDAPPPPPPPDTYVATVEPVYFNGQPTYWYGNHWYWRDAGGRWNYYHDEPGFLRDRRMHGLPDRHFDDRRGGGRRDEHGRR